MSELRIIPVVFGGKHFIITDHRMQYDYGQVLDFKDLELPDSFEARFSNSPVGESIGQIGTNNRIRIPKQFFESGEPIYCYITLHDEVTDGRTVYTTKVPIKPSSERTEEEPEPEEESIITQAITALNSAVATTTQKAQEATESADRAEHAAEGVEGYAERAEAAQSASESARDRAVEAETSARTSAATTSEKASEAINSATAASQSAITAENASESAQEYATASAESALGASRFAVDAGNWAYNASESAQTASTKASEASQKATEASQKASEAAQSASTAVQAKTDAQSAKTASETAQGLAESARDGAVTAKTGAESARDEAQDIVDGITGKVEQIDSNTDRIESLEDDRYKPYVVDTASGSIASFPDGADDIPLKSCIVQIEPVQAGSGDPSPENVRPITGWTGCEVQRTGKNLLPYPYFAESKTVGGITWTINGDGTVTVNGTASSTQYLWFYGRTGAIPIPSWAKTLAGKTVTVSAGNGSFVQQGYASMQMIFYGTPSLVIHERTATIPSDLSSYTGFACVLYVTGGKTVNATVMPQIELGSTPTPYEPYTGRTYPITFPSEAGTVYGAYVDVTGGELVVDRAIVDMGSLEWYKSTSPQRFESAVAIDNCKPPSLNSDVADILIECYKTVSANTTSENSAIAMNTAGLLRVYDSGKYEAMSRQEFKTAMSGVQLLYPLAEPIHYPLTATEIRTLLGQNNLWADTGDTEVEYRADTKLYIEKLTQPEEDDMIADSAISNGQFFMIGNSLYRALANIASGATITVGTNAERISLSDALNLVNA